MALLSGDIFVHLAGKPAIPAIPTIPGMSGDRRRLSQNNKVILEQIRVRRICYPINHCLAVAAHNDCCVKSMVKGSSLISLEQKCYVCGGKVMITEAQVHYYPNYDSPIKCIPCGRTIIGTPPFSQL